MEILIYAVATIAIVTLFYLFIRVILKIWGKMKPESKKKVIYYIFMLALFALFAFLIFTFPNYFSFSVKVLKGIVLGLVFIILFLITLLFEDKKVR